jgi:hypothetical protein
MNPKAAAVLLLFALFAPVSAGAHHSFAMFDHLRVVSITGTVKQFQWTNPHSWLQLEVMNDKNVAEEWSLEGLSPNVLGRMGWTRKSMLPGDVVTVYFNPTRDGSRGGNMIKVVRPDGTVIAARPAPGAAQ